MSAVGYAVGFRIHTNPLAFAAGLGVLLLSGCALPTIFALIGLAVRSVESTQAAAFPMRGPWCSPGRRSCRCRPCPGGSGCSPRNQPVSVTIDAVRALSQGGPATTPVLQSLALTVAIVVVSGSSAVRRYRRTA